MSMLALHRKMIQNYYGIVKAHYNQDTFKGSFLMNPPTEILEETTSVLHELIVDEATETARNQLACFEDVINDESEEELKEDAAAIIEKETVHYQIDVLRAVLIYALAYAHERGNEIINYMVQTNITDAINRFNTDPVFESEMVLYYIRYLVCKSEAMISSYVEEKIERENMLVYNLSYNKGISTIADLAKQAFIDLYEDLKDTHGYGEKMWSMLDRFINENVCLNYFEENNIDTSDKNYLQMVKKVLVRSILSDAYIDLKCTEEEYGDDDEEMHGEDIESIDYIEMILESGEYILPDDDLVRHNIYLHALIYNSEIVPYREIDFESLGEETKAHVITINPFSQI